MNLFKMDSFSLHDMELVCGNNCSTLATPSSLNFIPNSIFNVFGNGMKCTDLEVPIFISVLEETVDCIQILSKNDVSYLKEVEEYKISAEEIYREYVGENIFDRVTLESVETNKDQSGYTKRTKDRKYLQQILKLTIKELKELRIFPTLHEAIYYYEYLKIGERKILKTSRALTNYKNVLRRNLSVKEIDSQKEIAEINKQVTKVKEELHDAEVLYYAKIRFNENYIKARSDQNEWKLRNITNDLEKTNRETCKCMDNEEIIHEMTCEYLKIATKEITEKVLVYCDNYDDHVEALDNELIKQANEMDNLYRQLFKLQIKYEKRAIEMNNFRKRKDEYYDNKKNIAAATNIQAWFRGLCYRHGYMKKKKERKEK